MPEVKKDLITVNFSRGRLSKIDAIVVHVMEGTMSGTRSWFKNPDSKVSAHYGISLDGDIEQWVLEEDTAWANGRVLRPIAPLILSRPNINPNAYTISIECEGTGNFDLTDKQRVSIYWLIKDICTRRAIPVTRRYIIRHSEIFAAKSCPGKINVDKIVFDLNATTKVFSSKVPQIVYSPYFNDYLIVTRVVSDSEWYFIPLKRLSMIENIKAATKLSEMPNDKIN